MGGVVRGNIRIAVLGRTGQRSAPATLSRLDLKRRISWVGNRCSDLPRPQTPEIDWGEARCWLHSIIFDDIFSALGGRQLLKIGRGVARAVGARKRCGCRAERGIGSENATGAECAGGVDAASSRGSRMKDAQCEAYFSLGVGTQVLFRRGWAGAGLCLSQVRPRWLATAPDKAGAHKGPGHMACLSWAVLERCLAGPGSGATWQCEDRHRQLAERSGRRRAAPLNWRMGWRRRRKNIPANGRPTSANTICVSPPIEAARYRRRRAES